MTPAGPSDLWPKGPDQIVFDIAVNSGTGRAPQIMRAAMGNPSGGVATLARLATQSRDQVGIVKRACARRASFYRSLRTFSAFGRGWLARNARMEAIGVKMCLEEGNRCNKPLRLAHLNHYDDCAIPYGGENPGPGKDV